MVISTVNPASDFGWVRSEAQPEINRGGGLIIDSNLS